MKKTNDVRKTKRPDKKIKAAEKKNKMKKRNADSVVASLPHNQERNVISFAAGLLCRGLVAAALVVGIALFFCDAMVIVSEVLPFTALLYPALIFSVLLAFMSVNFYTTLGGGCLLFGGVALWLYSMHSSDFLSGIITSLEVFANAVIDRIAYAGLAQISQFRFDIKLIGEAEAFYMSTAVALFTFLIALLVVPAVVKRIRVLYLLAVVSVFVTPVLAYNVIRDNWGFSILISAIIGVISLYLYDKQYLTVSKKKVVSHKIGVFSNVRADASDAIPFTNNNDGEILVNDASEDAQKTVRSRRRGKDTDIESALTLETPIERRERKKRERKENRKIRCETKKAMKGDVTSTRRHKLPRIVMLENAALGGPVGLCTFIVVFALMLLPTALVKEHDTKIPFVSDVMETARVYMTGMLMGDEIDLNNISSLSSDHGNSGPRDITFDYPEFHEIVIATVEAPYDTPVYLRTWIGTTYNDNAWTSATLDEVNAYRERFGEAFTPEMITENFYSAFYPIFDDITDYAGYRDNTVLGFISERVNVTRKYENGILLYMPSFVMPSSGLMRYNSTDPSLLPYKTYFDGVWSSKFFTNGTSYSTTSLVTTFRHPSVIPVMNNNRFIYNYVMGEIVSGRTDRYISEGDTEKYVAEFEANLNRAILRFNGVAEDIDAYDYLKDTYGVLYVGDSLLHRYVFDMTPAERDALKSAYTLEKDYSDYVNSVYTQTDPDDNVDIRGITEKILSQDNKPILYGSLSGVDIDELIKDNNVPEEYYHAIVLELIDYMTRNCAYTTEPIEIAGTTLPSVDPENRPESAVVDFLTETKSGYCVQYASSLTMMLRSIGIPARYCEGYIATEFDSDFYGNDDPLTRYKCNVLDSDSHAWVEVYYDSVGWVQYEATDPYLDAMYGTGGLDSDINGSIDIPITTPEPDIEHDEDITPPLGKEELVSLKTILIVAAVVIAVGALTAVTVIIFTMRRRALLAKREREAVITRSGDRHTALQTDEIRLLSRKIIVGIFDIYKALDLSPNVGELSPEYAERLDEALGDTSRRSHEEVLEYISKEEFGYGMPRSELALLAEYYRDILDAVYRGLDRRHRIIFRYIKHII